MGENGLLNDIENGRYIAQSQDISNQLKKLKSAKNLPKCLEFSAESFDAMLDMWNAIVFWDGDKLLHETNAFAKMHNLLVETGFLGGPK